MVWPKSFFLTIHPGRGGEEREEGVERLVHQQLHPPHPFWDYVLSSFQRLLLGLVGAREAKRKVVCFYFMASELRMVVWR